MVHRILRRDAGRMIGLKSLVDKRMDRTRDEKK